MIREATPHTGRIGFRQVTQRRPRAAREHAEATRPGREVKDLALDVRHRRIMRVATKFDIHCH
eukprot:372931-Prymnesium_polylepis.1